MDWHNNIYVDNKLRNDIGIDLKDDRTPKFENLKEFLENFQRGGVIISDPKSYDADFYGNFEGK